MRTVIATSPEWVPHTIALPGGGEAVARLTVTAVAACGVDALSVALAHGAVLTLIDICKQKRVIDSGAESVMNVFLRLLLKKQQWIFITNSFGVAKTRKQSPYPSVGECMVKMEEYQPVF